MGIWRNVLARIQSCHPLFLCIFRFLKYFLSILLGVFLYALYFSRYENSLNTSIWYILVNVLWLVPIFSCLPLYRYRHRRMELSVVQSKHSKAYRAFSFLKRDVSAVVRRRPPSVAVNIIKLYYLYLDQILSNFMIHALQANRHRTLNAMATRYQKAH